MKTSKAMYIVLINTIILMVAEVIAHKKSNAVSVLGEAFHMLSDLLSVCLSILASHIVRRVRTAPNSGFTFGLARVEVISSVISLALLWGPSLYLLRMSVQRFFAPQDVERHTLLLIAGFSLLLNTFNFLVTRYLNGSSHCSDINVSSVYIHVISDLLQSLGVAVSAAALYINPKLTIVDLLTTVLSCSIAIYNSLGLLKELFRIVMEASPFPPGEVRDVLLSVPSVESVEDLHVWTISRNRDVLMAKVLIFPGEDPKAALALCTERMAKHFSFAHTNIEIKS